MNTCQNHPDREADGTCSVCGRFFCDDCLIPYSGTHVCRDCIGTLIPKDKSAPAEPPRKCYSIYVGLALILGVLGAHYFYSGRTGAGVAMFFVSVVSTAFTSFLGLPPAGLILTGLVALLSCFIKTDGYGREMI